ncbi:hypothetical protein ElyMa_004014800 [Elysia marginata]|uniref:Uncharacterized protein n=1 Tax=Elysia marginata TaxID=1093978 RepID=A0AAV4G2R2_9GAST|nr:hypothetical protein ElyMa_004014800 [Elysia marginata]
MVILMMIKKGHCEIKIKISRRKRSKITSITNDHGGSEIRVTRSGDDEDNGSDDGSDDRGSCSGASHSAFGLGNRNLGLVGETLLN